MARSNDPKVQEVYNLQAELDTLCAMFQQPGQTVVTRQDMSDVRCEIDAAIRRAGYYCTPTEGNYWRPRESARVDAR